MSVKTVIFGGSGFVGRRVAGLLVEAGHSVIIPTRDRERAKRDLIVLPNIDLVGCDSISPRVLEKLVSDADVIINLIGILHEDSHQTYEKIHVDFIRRLTDACTRMGKVRHLVQVSAIGATPGAPSKYLRSKGKGDALISKLHSPRWTIIRSSLLFGDQSDFVSMVSWQVKYLPLLSIPCANALFQPLFVDDLARMIAKTILNSACYGRTLAAAGPERMTLGEIYAKFQAVAQRNQPRWAMSRPLASVLATVMEAIPFVPPLLTRDNIASMTFPSVCESGNDAAKLVGTLTSLDDYLKARRRRAGYSQSGEFSRFRHGARRD